MTHSATAIDPYREQHKQRLSYMPWLYWSLKTKHKTWAKAWQSEWQEHLQKMETITVEDNCFIAPEAKLFAEPGRPIVIKSGSFIAADCVLHGPITLGNNVSINHHCTMDGGRAGIHIENDTRIACYAKFFAFNHGQSMERPIAKQPVTSEGIRIGKDVWVGADVKIVDGITIGDHAVVGMGSVVTKNIDSGQKAAGNPAVTIGIRDNH